jgi:hypothetical protein
MIKRSSFPLSRKWFLCLRSWATRRHIQVRSILQCLCSPRRPDRLCLSGLLSRDVEVNWRVCTWRWPVAHSTWCRSLYAWSITPITLHLQWEVLPYQCYWHSLQHTECHGANKRCTPLMWLPFQLPLILLQNYRRIVREKGTKIQRNLTKSHYVGANLCPYQRQYELQNGYWKYGQGSSSTYCGVFRGNTALFGNLDCITNKVHGH